jgi:ectoine hydroxylase-related dioxygenase (phytanoyl-CoA dioxygenase family)
MNLNLFLTKTFVIPFRIFISIPTRIIFGNLTGFSNNLSPIIDSLKQKTKKRNIFNEIKENGFIKINNNLDMSLVDIISNKFEKLINDKNEYLDRVSQRRLNDPIKKIPELKKLVESFKDEVLDYYQSSFYVEDISVYRNFTHESHNWSRQKYVYSNLWHSDDFKANKLKVFVLLTDNINKDTGATRIISIKNTMKLIRNFKFKHTSYADKNFDEYVHKNNLVNYFEGNKGDIYAFNPQKCLHAASIPIKSQYRDLICFEVYQYVKQNSYVQKVDYKSRN